MALAIGMSLFEAAQSTTSLNEAPKRAQRRLEFQSIRGYEFSDAERM